MILDEGVVGFLDEVAHSDTSSVATFCLPSALRIPKDSKFYVGLIMPFRVYGVKIVSGKEDIFICNEELLYALSVDSIKLVLPPEDTTLTNKLIDVMKGIDEDRKKRKE